MGGPGSSPLWALLVANAVPLLGTLFLGWQLAPILVLFWAESAVIGLVTLLRIFASPAPIGGKLVVAPFFCVHFGIFMLVHGVFLQVAIGGLDGSGGVGQGFAPFGGPFEIITRYVDDFRAEPALAWTLGGLLVSHLWSFVVHDLIRGERATVPLGNQLFRPYPRIVVMHLTLLLGLGLGLWLGDSWALAAVFVIAKTAADVAAHRRDHRARAVDPREQVLA